MRAREIYKPREGFSPILTSCYKIALFCVCKYAHKNQVLKTGARGRKRKKGRGRKERKEKKTAKKMKD